MPTTFHWLIKDRVIYARFSGNVTLSEIKQVATEGIQLVNSANADIQLVHGIVDNRDVTQFPKNTYQVNASLNDFLKNPRLGWILYVTDMNPILKMLSSVVAQIAKTRYRSFENAEDALQFLQYVDTTLPDLSSIDLSTLPVIQEINMLEGIDEET